MIVIVKKRNEFTIRFSLFFVAFEFDLKKRRFVNETLIHDVIL